MKRHHDNSNSSKGEHLIGWLRVSGVQFIILLAGHGSMQADVVLTELSMQKEVHLESLSHRKQEVIWDTGRYLEHRRPQSLPTVMHFLQENHTYFNKGS